MVGTRGEGFTCGKGGGRRSASQHASVEQVEPDMGMAGAQGAVRPLALQLAEHVLSFRDRYAPPFHFGHDEPLAIVRVRRDQVQFNIALPVPMGARKARPAKVLEHRGGMVVDQFTLLRRRVSPPQTLVRRMDAKPEADRRVLDAVEGLFRRTYAFADFKVHAGPWICTGSHGPGAVIIRKEQQR